MLIKNAANQCHRTGFKNFRRGLSLLIAGVFVFSQILSPVYAITPQELVEPTYKTPETPIEDVEISQPVIDTKEVDLSTEFLGREDALEELSPITEPEDIVETLEQRRVATDFETAIAQLIPDYAAAVFLDGISAEQLKRLTELEVEVGIVVLDNKLVLFTSGSKEEIRVNPVAGMILEEAALIAHTHPLGHGSYASMLDIQMAGEDPEYVVGSKGVFEYNMHGLSSTFPFTYEFLAEKINGMTDDYEASDEVIELLNTFIAAIDEYNTNPEDSVIFRSSDVTVFPNTPSLAFFDSVTPPSNVQVSQLDDEDPPADPDVQIINIDYNTTNGSFGGALLNFVDAPADISGLTKVTFDARTDNTTSSNCPATPVSNCTKVEFKDTANNTAAVFFKDLTTEFTQQDITIAEILAANAAIDLTNIKEIVFVIEHFRVVNQTDGFLDVRVGGLLQDSIEIPGQTHDTGTHTVLPNDPVLGAGDGRVEETHPTGKGKVIQTSRNEFTFDYNLNGGPTAFAFATVIPSSGPTMDLTQDVVLGIKGPDTGSDVKVKVEVEDVNGKLVKYILPLTSSFQNFTLDFAGLNIPPTFDRTQVNKIVFVVDRELTNFNFVNQIQIQTLGLDFQTPISGGAFDEGQHTDLADNLGLETEDGRVDISHPTGKGNAFRTSTNGIRFEYNLNGGPTAFTFAKLPFAGALPVALPDNVTFALRGAPDGRPIDVKVEFVDENGKKAKFIADLTSDFQNFTFDLTGENVPIGFDKTKVEDIVIAIDRDLANFNYVNHLDILIDTGFGYVAPFLDGGTHDPSLQTILPAEPTVFAGGGDSGLLHPTGKAKVLNPNRSGFTFDYNLNGGPGAFAFTGHNFATPVSLDENLVIGAKGPAGRAIDLKVEVKDDNGVKAEFILNLTDSLQNFTLNLTGTKVPAGFDRSIVKEIVFVVDRSLANFNYVNQIEIETPGLGFLSAATPSAFDDSLHTVLPVKPRVVTGNGRVEETHPTGKASASQTSSEDLRYDYNMNGGATAFSFVTWEFDGSFALPEDFVLGLKGPTGRPVDLKIEIEDENGLKAIFIADLTDGFQNFTINLSTLNVPIGFDKDKIVRMVFVMDRGLANFNFVGAVDIKTKGLDFAPDVSGTPLNEAVITQLSGTAQGISRGDKHNPIDTSAFHDYKQLSTEEFEFEYFLHHATSFSEVIISDVAPMNLDQNLVMALRGSENGRVKVEVIDVGGKKASYALTLKSIYQNFTMDLEGPHAEAGFDRTQVAEIRLINDADHTTFNKMDVIKVKLKGMEFTPEVLPQELIDFKNNLIQDALTYFQVGNGVDPVTHFPYDRTKADGTMEQKMLFSQPTSIGFYAQILGDSIAGLLDNGNTKTANLNELNAVLDSLLSVQQSTGWNGLLPWQDLGAGPTEINFDIIGLGDNANLAQSLAVMIGALENATLDPSQQALRTTITTKVEQFLDNQEAGYLAFVDGPTGLFHASLNTSGNPPTFNFFMDRLNTEFRGALAFLKIRYPSLPDTVWDNLIVQKALMTYEDQGGNSIHNLASFEGGAFQTFWPNLRNNENDFVGFRNVLYNHLATQADYAARNFIPGFLSASNVPNRSYFGLIGVPQIAETSEMLVSDVGSTYALASAYHIAPELVLTWLKAISDQLPNINGLYGLKDAAQSNTEISEEFLGIDVASTILGLADSGPKGFDTYLKNRNLEQDFNLLYDQANKIGVNKTGVDLSLPPVEFPDRSVSVLRQFDSDGVISNIPPEPTEVFGVPFAYQSLDGGFGGRFWIMPEPIEAAANRLVIDYTATILPNKLKVELKDGSGTQLLFENTVDLFNGTPFRQLVFDLPNDASLNLVQQIILVAEDGDAGDFFIHDINFQHFGSSQNLLPDPGLGAGDVSTLPGSPVVQVFGSNQGNTITNPETNVLRLSYDITGNGFAGFSLNNDPNSLGTTVDLSGGFTFGASSDTVRSFKLEIDDVNDKRAIVVVKNVDTTKSYYAFLTSLVSNDIDLTQVKRINLVVDDSSIETGGEIGLLDFEIDGWQIL